MTTILTAAEMKAADEQEISRGTPSRTLMERAARAALAILKEHFSTEKVLFYAVAATTAATGWLWRDFSPRKAVTRPFAMRVHGGIMHPTRRK